jgi:hypothetical protein
MDNATLRIPFTSKILFYLMGARIISQERHKGSLIAALPPRSTKKSEFICGSLKLNHRLPPSMLRRLQVGLVDHSALQVPRGQTVELPTARFS